MTISKLDKQKSDAERNEAMQATLINLLKENKGGYLTRYEFGILATIARWLQTSHGVQSRVGIGTYAALRTLLIATSEVLSNDTFAQSLADDDDAKNK